VFDKDVSIRKKVVIDINKCLVSTIGMPHTDIKTQLRELKEFYYNDGDIADE
jgi:hypothetical protein